MKGKKLSSGYFDAPRRRKSRGLCVTQMASPPPPSRKPADKKSRQATIFRFQQMSGDLWGGEAGEKKVNYVTFCVVIYAK